MSFILSLQLRRSCWAAAVLAMLTVARIVAATMKVRMTCLPFTEATADCLQLRFAISMHRDLLSPFGRDAVARFTRSHTSIVRVIERGQRASAEKAKRYDTPRPLKQQLETHRQVKVRLIRPTHSRRY
jgi:hypothetical protein